MTKFLREPKLEENDLEAGLAELTSNFTGLATKALPPMRIASNPTTDLGRLTSEAVLAQYEHAARSVEALGESIKDSVAKLQASMDDHVADLALITKAADHIREKGRAVQVQIAAASELSKEIREICAGFTKKNGG